MTQALFAIIPNNTHGWTPQWRWLSTLYDTEIGVGAANFYNAPSRLSGMPWTPVLEFTFETNVYQNMLMRYRDVFAENVQREMTLDGTALLTSTKPCEMCRVCWTYFDKLLGGVQMESATGLVSASSTVAPWDEQHTLRVHRGVLLLPDGTRVESSKNCLELP